VRTIILLTIIALWSLEFTGSIPKSSVGGPMTMMFVLLIAMLAVGLYEAWLNKRGPLGWIVNIFASVLGGLVVGLVAASVMDIILPLLLLPFAQFEGSLASSRHPLLYILEAGMAIVVLLGSLLALQIANRFR
jgi:hypothetical protein